MFCRHVVRCRARMPRRVRRRPRDFKRKSAERQTPLRYAAEPSWARALFAHGGGVRSTPCVSRYVRAGGWPFPGRCCTTRRKPLNSSPVIRGRGPLGAGRCWTIWPWLRHYSSALPACGAAAGLWPPLVPVATGRWAVAAQSIPATRNTGAAGGRGRPGGSTKRLAVPAYGGFLYSLLDIQRRRACPKPHPMCRNRLVPRHCSATISCRWSRGPRAGPGKRAPIAVTAVAAQPPFVLR